MPEARRSLRVVNPSGLHARPCHAIVSLALGFAADLRLSNGERDVNGKSIIELMTLDAGPGTELEAVALGDDADALLSGLEALFAAGFDESS